MGRGSDPLENGGHPLADPDTHGAEGVAASGLLQFEGRGEQQAEHPHHLRREKGALHVDGEPRHQNPDQPGGAAEGHGRRERHQEVAFVNDGERKRVDQAGLQDRPAEVAVQPMSASGSKIRMVASIWSMSQTTFLASAINWSWSFTSSARFNVLHGSSGNFTGL